MKNTENSSATNFNLSIDTSSKVIAKMNMIIHAPLEKVWQVLMDINSWPNWNQDVRKVNAPIVLKLGSKFRWTSGGVNIQSEIHTFLAPNVIAWKGKTMGLKAIHNWCLKTENGQTIVYVEESMSGWLCKLMPKVFNKMLNEGMMKQLLALKSRVENIN
jgi:uncharacterized protein YndB with AHSA1/START domain